jgi:hypothetical protein
MDAVNTEGLSNLVEDPEIMVEREKLVAVREVRASTSERVVEDHTITVPNEVGERQKIVVGGAGPAVNAQKCPLFLRDPKASGVDLVPIHGKEPRLRPTPHASARECELMKLQ